MTDQEIKQMVIDDYAKMSDGVRQCQPRMPRTDREWAETIKFMRIMGVK